MTVMEHLKAAGFDIENAQFRYGNGQAECEKVLIETKEGSDSYGPLLIVKARAYVYWSDGTNRPYPEFGWDGEEKGYSVTACLRGDAA